MLLADDHAPTREIVREALEGQDCDVVAERRRRTMPLSSAAVRLRPDVCLLDIHMPGSGIAAAAEITHSVRRSRVVMLTASAEDRDLFAALRAGAAGYLVKGMDPRASVPALRSVMAGESVLPRWLVVRWPRSSSRPPAPVHRSGAGRARCS